MWGVGCGVWDVGYMKSEVGSQCLVSLPDIG